MDHSLFVKKLVQAWITTHGGDAEDIMVAIEDCGLSVTANEVTLIREAVSEMPG